MGLDSVKNFSKSSLASGINNSVTSLNVQTGHGTKFPSTSFNAVIWNYTDYFDPSDDPDVEVVRVTNIATDTFTIVRAQEGTSAANHNTGGKTYAIIAPLTAKTISDISTIANFTPGANFTLTQNSVVPLISVESGAVANTLVLKAGVLGVGTATPYSSNNVKLDLGAGKLCGGTYSSSFTGSNKHILDIQGNPSFPGADWKVGATTYFRQGMVSVKGTNDAFFQGLVSSSGYTFFESYGGAGAVIGTGGNSNPVFFQVNRNEIARVTATGMSIGTVAAPTARLHIAAGSASANTAPIKLNSGTLNTTAEAGAFEFLTDALYFTITTGAARKTVAFLEAPVFTGKVTLGSDVAVSKTIIAPGTTGDQTINKTAGRVNIAAAGTSITVTNSLVDANSIIVATCATNDTTAQVKNVVASSGSFVINVVGCTAETAINFVILN